MISRWIHVAVFFVIVIFFVSPTSPSWTTTKRGTSYTDDDDQDDETKQLQGTKVPHQVFHHLSSPWNSLTSSDISEIIKGIHKLSENSQVPFIPLRKSLRESGHRSKRQTNHNNNNNDGGGDSARKVNYNSQSYQFKEDKRIKTDVSHHHHHRQNKVPSTNLQINANAHSKSHGFGQEEVPQDFIISIFYGDPHSDSTTMSPAAPNFQNHHNQNLNQIQNSNQNHHPNHNPSLNQNHHPNHNPSLNQNHHPNHNPSLNQNHHSKYNLGLNHNQNSNPHPNHNDYPPPNFELNPNQLQSRMGESTDSKKDADTNAQTFVGLEELISEITQDEHHLLKMMAKSDAEAAAATASNAANFVDDEEEEMKMPNGAVLIPPLMKWPTRPPPMEPESRQSVEESDVPKGAVIIPPPMDWPPLEPSYLAESKESVEDDQLPKGAILIPHPKQPLFTPDSPDRMGSAVVNDGQIHEDIFSTPLIQEIVPDKSVPVSVGPSRPTTVWQPEAIAELPKTETPVEKEKKEEFLLPKGAILIPPRGKTPMRRRKKPPVTQFQSPPAQLFQNPSGQQFQDPNGQQFQDPNGQQFQDPNGQQFQDPNGQQFQHPSGQQFQDPNGQQFQGPNGQQFQDPNGQQFQNPNIWPFQNPNNPNLNFQQFQDPNMQFQNPYVPQFDPNTQQNQIPNVHQLQNQNDLQQLHDQTIQESVSNLALSPQPQPPFLPIDPWTPPYQNENIENGPSTSSLLDTQVTAGSEFSDHPATHYWDQEHGYRPPRPRPPPGHRLKYRQKMKLVRRNWKKIKRIAGPLITVAATGIAAHKLFQAYDYIHHIKAHSNSSYPLLSHFGMILVKALNLTGGTPAAASRNPLSFLPILTSSFALAIIATASFFRFIIGGPLVSLAFMFIMMIMSPGFVRAYDTVQRINRVVPLTTYGKFVTGVRAFLGMSTTEHLPILGGVTSYNDEISKNAAQFLRINPDIHTIITPSIKETKKRTKRPRRNEPWWCQLPGLGSLLARTVSGSGCSGANSDSYTQFIGSYEPHKNSFVNLTSFYVDSKGRRDVAEKLVLGEYLVFCADEKKKKKKTKKSKYCTNAIALGQKGPKKDATSYYFDLKDGNDTAVGRRGFQNTFLVENGHKFFQGQDKDDTFILTRSGASGVLDGRGGDNTLVLQDSFEKNNFVTLNLSSSSVRHIPLNQSTGSILRLFNMNRILGRSNEGDKFIPGCRTKFLDGQSGKSLQISDIIEIPEESSLLGPNNKNSNNKNKNYSCTYNMTIQLSRFTKVFNHALQGNFTYLFPSSPADAKGVELNIFGLERLNFDPRGRHKILLNWELSKISSLKFQKGPGILKIKDNESGFVFATKVIRNKSITKNNSQQQQPTFYTMLQDGLTPESEIKVTPTGDLAIFHRLDITANKISSERHGFFSIPNTFSIFGGHWMVRGGGMADTFLVHKKFTGYLDGGGGGNNSLVLVQGFLPRPQKTRNNRRKKGEKSGHVEIDLQKNYLTYSSSAAVRVTIENIQRVMGRPKETEEIIIHCQTLEVDGRGGFSGREPDIVQIPRDDACLYHATVVINDHTIVRNFATKGEFFYKMNRHGVFDVESKFPPKTIHNYILSHPFKEIKSAIFDTNTNRMSFQYKLEASKIIQNVDRTDGSHFHASHWVKFSQTTDPKELFNVAPNILTTDGVKFKASRAGGDLVAFVEFKNGDYSGHLPFEGLDGIHHWIELGNATHLNVRGGDLEDNFVLVASGEGGVSGFLDGMGGKNILRLASGLRPLDSIYLDFLHHQIILDDHDQHQEILNVHNFSSIYGRRWRNDTIVVGCDTKFVSGMGGHDKIIVNDLSTTCLTHDDDDQQKVTMEFVIPPTFPNSTTRVINLARSGTFIYRLEGLTPFQVELTQETADNDDDDEENKEPVDSWSLGQGHAYHVYQYRFKIEEIEKMIFDHHHQAKTPRLSFRVKGQEGRHIFFVPLEEEEEKFFSQPKFMTADNVQISVTRENGRIHFIFAEKNLKQDSDLSVQEIVQNYETIATKFNASIILVTKNGENVLIQDGGPLNTVLELDNHHKEDQNHHQSSFDDVAS